MQGGQFAIWLFNPAAPEVTSSKLYGFRLPPALASGARYAFVTDWYLNTKRVGRK
jgi:hypothetical protein